jgi:DNA polymerase-3 subunit gamma/tau
MAEALPMPVLARTWQMLLKGLSETRAAPSPLAAAEMVLVRLAYAADLPSPADAVRQMRGEAGPAGQASQASQASPASQAGPTGGDAASSGPRQVSAVAPERPRGEAAAGPDTVGGGGQAATARLVAPESVSEPEFEPGPEAEPEPDGPVARDREAAEDAGKTPLASFRAVVDYVAAQGEPLLAASLALHVHLVRFSPGRIEINLGEGAEPKLPSRLGELLTKWTGERWMVTVSGEPGDATLKAQEDADRAARLAAVEAHPLVRAVREAFPGARITGMREHAAGPALSEGETADDDQGLPDGDKQA